jgi:hypothetical protein
LLAAWRFLGQCAPPDSARNVPEFWSWAIARWDCARIPATVNRLAPTATV